MPQHPDIDEMAEKRLERVSRFCAIIGAAWLTFGIYYTVIGVWFTAGVCLVEATAALIATYVAHKYPGRRLLTANGFLGISMAGIICESLGSGLGISSTPMFLCCVGLMAAHQTGIRSALKWTLAVLAAQLMIHVVLDPAQFPIYRVQVPLEHFLVSAGVTIVIYAMSHQAEWTFDRYAKQYIEASDELREQARSLRLAERVAKVGHWNWDANSDRFRLSKEAIFICGFDDAKENEYSEAEFLTCLVPESQEKLQESLDVCRRVRHNFALDLRFKPGNAAEHARYIGFSEVDGQRGVTHVFGVLKDETESNKVQSELNEKADALRDLAEFDQLTGLANRRTFHTHLADSAQTCKTRGGEMALLLIDLDGFKEINDTMGHATGDSVLREVAIRLEHVMEETDRFGCVARLGGDEFTVVVDACDECKVTKVAEEISARLSRPFTIDSKNFRLGASIGAAIFPTDTEDLTELLSFADTAMYEAKSQRTGLKMYDVAMTEKIAERRGVEAQLRNALEENEFYLDYQPQFSSRQELCGVEALIRWKHEGEIISPGVFIPYLEASHAILDVGRWVLLESCRQARSWFDMGHPIRVSVNVSAVQFRHHDFVREVRQAIEMYELPPHLLDIEITESVVVEEMDRAETAVERLKHLGVHLSIDDFGTGYSSLSYLKHLPCDRLKIDRAFIKDYPQGDDGTLAKTIVVLAHSLKMRAVAEGVETEDQLQFLREQDCDEFQGFLLGRPTTPEAIETLLKEQAMLTSASLLATDQLSK